ncbi:uncharacterized protein EI90DRAFT_3116469 [Cantharellus anzutake]|uniref:uncharacterized protein n=1 Tax=Cantharellus anzutake TaxID=1750568 RepID=UPI001904AB10|nr:uncharacterized protein EI90DRAFT_3131625 [Cantharellus anzutake]XP_038922276.1 uncharacterized protein EI90DRAFT_3116469 [Cantharellus anzutake]KAF8321382.1 hypothetical protein EI90DRAFT_3131625 [Cantharellus anzutake]KAF8341344.1 hypothetical protein EI90DRAFT_3116469 [Cantharellus anzutake]
MSISPNPSSSAFRSRRFQAPTSSEVAPPADPPTNTDPLTHTDTYDEINDGTDADGSDPGSGDITSIKSVEKRIREYAALYAVLYSPFLSKASLRVELNSNFHSWTAEAMFSSEANFSQYCVHKILEMKYSILTDELRTHSGVMPWLAKFVSDVGARRRQMMSRLRKSSLQLFGMDLSVTLLKSGHGPTAEERQQHLGIIPDSPTPIDHLPLFLFPNNDRSCRQHVFRSQVVAAAIIVIIFGPAALNDAVSAIPLPGSPLLEDWESARLHASPKALGVTHAVTEITPGTVAIVAMLVYFMLSGDTELVSAHGKPSHTNYLDILLNFYKFILTVLKREETATLRPMHETMQWYQHLLFGSPARTEESNLLVEGGGLAGGLDALLAEMDVNDSEEPETDPASPNMPSEEPQGPEPDVQTEVVASSAVSLGTRHGRRGRVHRNDSPGDNSSREVSRGRRGQRQGSRGRVRGNSGRGSRRGHGSHGGQSAATGDE